MFNTPRCHRRLGLPITLALILTSGHAIAADAAPWAGGDVASKLADVEAEVGLLRKAGPAQFPAAARYADELEKEVRVLRADWEAADAAAPAAGAADAAPELYVVGFYEGSMPNGPKKFGMAAVEVQVTDRPVVLALCAYEPIRWNLRLAPGVRLRRVILAGHGEQLLEPAPAAQVPVERRFAKAGDAGAFYTYPGSDDSGGSAHPAEALRSLTGLPMTTLQGGYRYADQPIIVGPRDTEWRRQRVMSRLEPLWREATALRRAEARLAVSKLRFTAIRWKSGLGAQPEPEVADFTPAGWIQGTSRPLRRGMNHLARDPRGPTWFGLADRSDAVRLDLAAGGATKIEIKEDVPEFSWPCGLAFDTKRNRLLVVTLGGSGYLYACDPAADTWSIVRDMNNLDLQCLAYLADEDCLYGVESHSGGRSGLTLCQLTPDGELVRKLRIKADVSSDPISAHLSPIQAVPVGKQLVLLVPPTRAQLMEAARAARRPPGVRLPPDAPVAAREVALARAAAMADEPVVPMKCLIVNPADGAVVFADDMAPLPPAAADPAPADGRALQQQWTQLRTAAPADADKAASALGVAGDGAVAVIRAALPPAPAVPDEATLRATLARLESDDWKRREEAAAQLVATGAAAEPALRAALAAGGSDDARQRLDAVLKQIESLRDARASDAQIDETLGDSPLRTRLRAVRALSKIGTPAAAQLLREIAAGDPGSVDVVQARRALRKL